MGVRRTALKVGLAAGLAAGLVPALGVSSAHACNCVTDDDALFVRTADVIFTGTLLTQERIREGDGLLDRLFGGAEYVDDVVLTFAADRVYKGTASARQQIRTPAQSPACGLELSGPGPFLVFARLPEADPVFTGPGPELVSSSCSGTRPVSSGQGAEALGLGRGDVPVAAPIAAGPARDDGFPTSLVLAGSLAGAAALGAAWVGRRTFRRRAASSG